MNRSRQLREFLKAGHMQTAMAVHNPLSARLVEEAGFDCLWGSGFELSASYAVPDANILPFGTHLEMMRAIASVTTIPLIADLDTGFGNAVTLGYILPQYEAAGVAAIVVEDKTFPKDTSLRENARQVLVDVATFEGKIRACKAAQLNPDFVVIARTEALIAGLSIETALERAKAYAGAGADAVLVHSKQTTPDEILAFVERWDLDTPLVLVPTAYPQLREADIRALKKVGIVIYGNHAIRSATWAMREIFRQIREQGGIHCLPDDFTSVNEIIELQGDAKMRDLERLYLR
ncbi:MULTISPECIES: phosphonopyruvate hydrolase [unclassified Halomonas]|uniref:phosphonopyruvate hydrolase n=1 Tax=Halomonas sp. N3-2A TaxID=2014541 RepID=UPI000B5B1BCC|nr:MULTISPECIES: phosphonopyruvate hydrolase [unclassified Halomonas]ASK19753.1 phosphonopyruvate hydrolase [Halomonas sp. N3-2A]UTD53732.1 phosphonopyruvate hydrolase [Halomonas sp. MS1]